MYYAFHFSSGLFKPEYDMVQMASALLSLLEGRGSTSGPVSKPSLVTGQLKSLNDFPDEILLKILSHFGPEDLCLIIAKVCVRWNALARDRTLWKTLSYTCNYKSEFSRVVQVSQNLLFRSLLFGVQ
jgi:hypothetical protein